MAGQEKAVVVAAVVVVASVVAAVVVVVVVVVAGQLDSNAAVLQLSLQQRRGCWNIEAAFCFCAIISPGVLLFESRLSKGLF